MGKPMNAAEHHTALSDAAHLIGVQPYALWLNYFGLCGNLTPLDIEAYICGLAPLPAADRSILEQALWELDPVLYGLAVHATRTS